MNDRLSVIAESLATQEPSPFLALSKLVRFDVETFPDSDLAHSIQIKIFQFVLLHFSKIIENFERHQNQLQYYFQ